MKAVVLLLLGLAISLHHILAQNPPGFISLDCGLEEINGYNDSVIGLHYTTDADFIETGDIRSISPEFQTDSVPRQFLKVRSFPNEKYGIRNCYTLMPSSGKGSKVLLRAGFMYGNYDNQKTLPQFDLHLGVDYWDTVTFEDSSTVAYVEIIHIPKSEYLHVCLVNTGGGTPFISVLELRPMDNGYYDTTSGSLQLLARWDLGSTIVIRYKDGDTYDRIWSGFELVNTTVLSSAAYSSLGQNFYNVPAQVMATAAEAQTVNDSVIVPITANSSSDQLYSYLHFAELSSNQSREMNIYRNGALYYPVPFVPEYLITNTVYSTVAFSASSSELEIKATPNSALPPILNAVEFYTVKLLTHYETNDTDAAAIMSIKATYAITTNSWQGDPCSQSTQNFTWIGINCSYLGFEPPRIISLNLSSSGLVGTIAPAVSNLTMLQSLDLSCNNLSGEVSHFLSSLPSLRYLDLSYNNLTGEVPDFLSHLPSLRYLYLQGNEFIGSLPPGLLEKSRNGSLILRELSYNNLTGEVTGFQPRLPSMRYSYLQGDASSISLTPESSPPAPTPEKWRNEGFGVPTSPSPAPTPEKWRNEDFEVPTGGAHDEKKKAIIAASVTAFIAILVISTLSYIIIRRKRIIGESKGGNGGGPLIEPMLRQCTFSEVMSMIGEKKVVLGEGGFGIVYRGIMNEVEVAVKILKPSAELEITKDLKSEVKILARIHHKNLTRILGYCNEGLHRAIIFELLENGSLKKHLSESSPKVLSWELRLSIMTGAAQGVEYLHRGCTPPIVHRDIKPENILLTKDFEAKLADFGLSRFFPAEITRELGTLGYYNNDDKPGMLTEQMDIYSFGVVLLVVVTGQPAITEDGHITQRIAPKIRNGDIRGIVDPRLEKNYDVNVAWKVVELGMACTSRTPPRPHMLDVVKELNECLQSAGRGQSDGGITVRIPSSLITSVSRPSIR